MTPNRIETRPNHYLAIMVIFSLFPAKSFAQNVERILFKGSELLYPLPKGFCNITQEMRGNMMKELIDQQKDPMFPVAQLIMAPF